MSLQRCHRVHRPDKYSDGWGSWTAQRRGMAQKDRNMMSLHDVSSGFSLSALLRHVVDLLFGISQRLQLRLAPLTTDSRMHVRHARVRSPLRCTHHLRGSAGEFPARSAPRIYTRLYKTTAEFSSSPGALVRRNASRLGHKRQNVQRTANVSICRWNILMQQTLESLGSWTP